MKSGIVSLLSVLVAITSVTAQEDQSVSDERTRQIGYLRVFSTPDDCEFSITGLNYSESFNRIGNFVKIDSLAVGKYSASFKTPSIELTETILIKSDTITLVAVEFSENRIEISYRPPATAKSPNRKDVPFPDEFGPGPQGPEMIHFQAPEYPQSAKEAGITGTVWVKAHIDERGNVTEAAVVRSSGTECLDEAAVHAAYKSKFTPCLEYGEPISIWISYPVTFEL